MPKRGIAGVIVGLFTGYLLNPDEVLQALKQSGAS